MSILYDVLGLGCSEVPQRTLRIVKSQLTKIYKIPCEIICNNSLKSTLKNIGKTVCYIPPSKKSKVVRDLYSNVIKNLKHGKKVIIFGHSYGGSVASRVAELLHDNQINTSRILIVTFGSIYVPHPSKTLGVNIKHIMFENDVALKCNHLNPKKDLYVDWRIHPLSHLKSKWYQILGSDIQWEIHNDYGPEIKLPLLKNFIATNRPMTSSNRPMTPANRTKALMNRTKTLANRVRILMNRRPRTPMNRPRTPMNRPRTPMNRPRTPRNAPKFFINTRAAPKMKPINVKLNNVSNYTNMRRKILKATNVPGTYELRRKLLANLNRKLYNLPRENFISLSNITPSKNTHYVLKNGNHPGTWLYLEPNSFHNLALKVGRRGTFTHPTTRRLVNIRNFKIVKR
jgi:pimeloyl-ACP methyl ester carboxylesterase